MLEATGIGAGHELMVKTSMSIALRWAMMGLVASAAFGRLTFGQVVGINIAGNPAGDVITRPVAVVSAPGDYRRIFVVSQIGLIRSIDISQPNPVKQPTSQAFLNIAPQVFYGVEQGLLGLAFHPQFQSNGKFYVYFTSPRAAGLPAEVFQFQSIVEYVVRDPITLEINPRLQRADPASARLVMRIPHPTGGNHNGGWIGFGPEGYLYLSVGDGADGNPGVGSNATIGNSQDTGTPMGKILRIDVDSPGPAAQGPFWTLHDGATTPGAANYGIPVDNPVLPAVMGATLPARKEIWAYGVRNPWRCSFDRLTGDFWIGDVGEVAWEEINFQPALGADNAGQVAGRNYGWRCWEGSVSYNLPAAECTAAFDDGGAVGPVGVYPHAIGTISPPRMLRTAEGGTIMGCAVIGGVVYRGCEIPEMYGSYLFADFCDGININSFPLDAASRAAGPLSQWNICNGSTAVSPSIPALSGGSFTALGEDAYGELYVADLVGRVIRLVNVRPGTIPLANPDYDRNGLVNVQDIFSFLEDWFNATPRADFNRSGTINVQDIFDYLAAWFAGCP
jgi:glucose/arabinose dehydrogenase